MQNRQAKPSQRTMQNIVLFIAPAFNTSTYNVPSKIGNLFINRFAINEEENSEILKIVYLPDLRQSLYLEEGIGLEND